MLGGVGLILLESLTRRCLAAFLESIEGIFASYSFDFELLVLGQEILDGHEASANSHENLPVGTQLHVNSLGAVPVDALALTNKEHVEVVTVNFTVEELGEFLVDLVKLLGDVDDL